MKSAKDQDDVRAESREDETGCVVAAAAGGFRLD